MPENELIIRHKGKEYDFELTEHDADRISDLTAVIELAPFHEPSTLMEMAEQAERAGYGRRIDESRRVADDFQMPLRRLANLDGGKMAQVIAFLDLIDLGDLDGSQSNWALEFIELLLYDVIRHGAAGALHQDPRGFLSSLSHFTYNYWRWVKDNREVLERHPEIFPPPPAEPEPARKHRKAPATRKRGRKVA